MKHIITTLGIAICLVATSVSAQTPPPLPTVPNTAPVTDTKGLVEAVKEQQQQIEAQQQQINELKYLLSQQ